MKKGNDMGETKDKKEGFWVDLLFEEVGPPEKEYKKLKLEFEEIQRKQKSKFILLTGIICSILITLFFFSYFYIDSALSVGNVFISSIIGISLGIVTALLESLMLETRKNRIQRKMLEYEAEDVKEEVKEDIFENSIKMSYKYLDQYYLQTREQAQRGFFVTVCVAILGAILIGVGIATMFWGQTQPSYVTCGAGVITEFIAAIFFYLYNRTVSSMCKYHNKLVISQNISIALKVAESLPSDDKAKAKNKIIDELLKDVNIHLVKSDTDN